MSDPLSSFARRLLPAFRERRLPASFDELALGLFRAQWASNEAYRRFAAASGVDLEAVRRWEEIPAVPTVAFKELEMTSLAAERRTRVFHSSGTTGHRPSRHFHGVESMRVYEASLEAGFTGGFWRGAGGTEDDSSPPALGWSPVSLTPPASEVPHSSLVHMIDRLGSRLGHQAGFFAGYLGREGAWELDFPRLMEALREGIRLERPMVLFGTAFLFVHLIEGMDREGTALRLPAGSRVMETGGYKGRTREWAKAELRAAIVRCLGVAPGSIVGEYGMSELSSQAYEEPPVPGEDGLGARGFVFPPWARPLVISPESGKPAGLGEAGLLRVVDLANVWSVMAVQTEDRAVDRGGTIELLGRAPMAERRGCSLMAA